MKFQLYLVSPYEEYPNKHMCRGHWNYKWGGRRRWDLYPNKKVKLRKETFGGLLRSIDGKIYKLDAEGYRFVHQILDGFLVSDICDDLNLSLEEGRYFAEKLNELGVKLNG